MFVDESIKGKVLHFLFRSVCKKQETTQNQISGGSKLRFNSCSRLWARKEFLRYRLPGDLSKSELSGVGQIIFSFYIPVNISNRFISFVVSSELFSFLNNCINFSIKLLLSKYIVFGYLVSLPW